MGPKNWPRCMVCRAAINWYKYNGDYEVTMLLSTLYLVALLPIESKIQKDRSDVSYRRVDKWLKCNNISISTDGLELDSGKKKHFIKKENHYW